VQLIIGGGLQLLFLYFIKRYRGHSVLSWLNFFGPNSVFTFYSLQHHVHIRNRRVYDEQKAVVVMKHHHQGCQLDAGHANTYNELSWWLW